MTLHSIRIKDVFNLEIAKHVYKFYAHSLPDVFNEQYTLVSNTHNYHTRSSINRNICVHRTNKEIGKRTSTVFGALVWNKNPTTMRKLPFNSFKREYKASILASYAL